MKRTTSPKIVKNILPIFIFYIKLRFVMTKIYKILSLWRQFGDKSFIHFGHSKRKTPATYKITGES